jgi:hypothetical protein
VGEDVSEAQFRAICDASPIGILLTDLAGACLLRVRELLDARFQ